MRSPFVVRVARWSYPVRVACHVMAVGQVTFTVGLPAELAERVGVAAEAAGLRRNRWVRQAGVREAGVGVSGASWADGGAGEPALRRVEAVAVGGRVVPVGTCRVSCSLSADMRCLARYLQGVAAG